MTAFDFDEEVDRRNTASYKWNCEDPEVIPMWVADMDFKTAPVIVEALQKRVAHGVFGYTAVPESFYEAVEGWFERRHGWKIGREEILYTSGVVPAITVCLKALTRPGDAALILTPVYNCFFSCIRNNGLSSEESMLKVAEDGRYTVDWEDFEERAAKDTTKVFLLCNPHNPGGRVWTREELSRMNDICARHGVAVVADEIHCEFVFGATPYTAFATVHGKTDARRIVLAAPSKSFNTAGLQIAVIVSGEEEVRAKIDRAINDNEVCDVNPFGVLAATAAYNEGGAWLDALIDYLRGNDALVREVFANELPELSVMPLEGTYLEWVDISALGIDGQTAEDELKSVEKVWINAGEHYGKAAGNSYIRINIATNRARLAEGLRRIVAGLRRLGS